MIVERPRLPLRAMLTFGLLPSAIKKWWYRRQGARIGAGVRFRLGSTIRARESLEIGAGTSFGMFSAIDAVRVRIGKRTEIRHFVLIDAHEVLLGDDVRISETALIRTLVPSPQSRIELRNRAHVFPFAIIDPTRPVVIGEESSVGMSSYIYSHGAYKSLLEGYPVVFAGVDIGDRVWIPSRVTIMPGVRIGHDAVIGAGAVVNSEIPEGAFAVGSPARVVKQREEFARPLPPDERFRALIPMIDEFGQYLQDYAGFSARREERLEAVRWTFAAPDQRAHVLELVRTADAVTDTAAAVIIGAVAPETQRRWDAEKRMWFSIGSNRCSSYLDDLGEELRDFLQRWGLYFERP